MADSSKGRNPLEILAEDFLERYRRGERPSLTEYAQRHPEIADEIRGLLPALLVMEDVRPAENEPAAPNSSVSSDIEPPTRLGDFRIIREVGRGGMGLVYEAEQVSLGRRVALKVLPRQTLLDSKHKKRFLREAKAAARLHHTNIVPVFGVGHQDGLHYYVMQFIHGLGLDEVLVELQRLRSESPASGGRKPTDSAPAAVPAGAVAHSLLTGHFERTRLVDSDSDDSAQQSALSDQLPETGRQPATALNSPLSTLPSPDTTVGQLSDTLHASGAFPLDTTTHSRTIYWQSVARIGLQAAQALQYAHDQGIIHRDVKPGNLLLDTGGSVWVTDFGLAKAADQQDLTNTGDVLGTLRYMAPEQFDGQADERSDVYSLGLTLYELLALKPAFDETERHKLVRQVTTGAPPRLRTLDPHIPRDLETIVLKSIEKEPTDRYATAEEFAADLCRFLDDQPIAAARPNVLTNVRKWSRRHRPAMWAAVTSLVVSALVVAGGLGWIARDRAARRALMQQEVTRALQEAEEWQDKGNWPQALTAARRAESLLLAGETNEPLDGRVRELLRSLKLLSRLEQIRTETKSQLADKPLFDYAETDRCYAAAFREFGLDPANLPDHFLDGAGHFRSELAAALHDWADTRRSNGDSNWEQLLNAAQTIDLNPWRRAVRRAWAVGDRAALEALADSVVVHEVSPATLYLLALALARAGNDERAYSLLRESQRAYADDFWINCLLGQLCRSRNEDDAIRFYTSAKALRPDSDAVTLTLGRILAQNGRFDEAIAELREGMRRRPDLVWYHVYLGDVLYENGMVEEAVGQYRSAIGADPTDAGAHNELGRALADEEKLPAAIASYRIAIRLDPKLADAHSNLGAALSKLERFDEAVTCLQKAITLDPDSVQSHINLGVIRRKQGKVEAAIVHYEKAIELDPKSVRAHRGLGVALRLQGEWDRAASSFQMAIEVNPTFALAHVDLGILRRDEGKLDEAIIHCRNAIDAAPNYLRAHVELGRTLRLLGKFHEAIPHYQRAIELDPTSAPLHVNLGCLLCDDLQLYDEAIAEFRKAIGIDSNYALAHHNLAVALYKKGELDEALVAVQECLQCDPNYPRAHNTLIDLARACAESGRWEQAASAFGLALELEAQDHLHWFQYAALLLYTGDVGAYRHACREMLGRFGDTSDPYIAERVAKTCLLVPPGAGEPDLVRTLAERAVRGTEEYPDYAWFALTKALAEYRAGNPDSAGDWLQQVPQEEHLQHRNVTALALMAMARHRLDRHEEATEALAAAQAILADRMPHPDRGESFGEDWHDWLHAQIVCREAEELMTTTRETTTDR